MSNESIIPVTETLVILLFRRTSDQGILYTNAAAQCLLPIAFFMDQHHPDVYPPSDKASWQEAFSTAGQMDEDRFLQLCYAIAFNIRELPYTLDAQLLSLSSVEPLGIQALYLRLRDILNEFLEGLEQGICKNHKMKALYLELEHLETLESNIENTDNSQYSKLKSYFANTIGFLDASVKMDGVPCLLGNITAWQQELLRRFRAFLDNELTESSWDMNVISQTILLTTIRTYGQSEGWYTYSPI